MNKQYGLLLFLLGLFSCPAFAQLPPGVNIIDPAGMMNGGGNLDPFGNNLNNITIPSKTEKPAGEKIEKIDPEIKKTEEELRTKEEDEREILALKRQTNLPDARIWGQQFFRDQSISLFTRARDVKALEQYILGVGDELTLTIWGCTDYSANVLIEKDGYIDLSGDMLKVPRLYLNGMQFSDAKKAIIERMRHHVDMDCSQWAIELNFKRNLTVNIVGEVFNPGSYTMPAVNTAFNALVAAGGPSQIGSVRNIRVESAGKPSRVLDVYQFITNPNAADAFFLENNDYIFVPLAGRVVEIQGAVKRPFFYELIDGENLLKLLYYAGGLQADAYRYNIQITRYEDDEERLRDLNLRDLLNGGKDFELKNGDKIVIAPIKQAYSNYVQVVGAVKLPGQYELEKETKVRDVLLKAGVIYSAVMDRVYVKRLREDLSIEYIDVSVYDLLSNPQHEDNIVLRPLDEIEVKYKSEFIDKYNIRVFGAIRKPGQYEYSRDLSLNDILYMSNGIRKEAAGSYIEISRLKRSGTGSDIEVLQYPINDSLQVVGGDNIFLEPYDQVFVRLSKDFEFPKNIVINGEILYPGVYTIEDKNERIYDLLKRCGGTTSIAFLEGATLQRQVDGYVLLDLRELIQLPEEEARVSRFNYLLKDGDVITVPKVKELVSVAGRVRHPYIKETKELKQMELDKAMLVAVDDVDRKTKQIDAQIAETKNPIKVNVPYHQGKKAMFYVREYGAGIDRENGGRKRLIFVRYANGLVRKTRNFGLFSVHPKVEQGAMVYVGERPPKVKKQRNPVNINGVANVTSMIISQVTAGATLYLLISKIIDGP